MADGHGAADKTNCESMQTKRFDSLIFDMDGTLWDAVDTYRDIWNEAYRRMGVDATVTRDQLIECMGMPIEAIMERLAPATLDRDRFAVELGHTDAELMPVRGGRLYDGVAEFIPELASRYRLMMVSNCGVHGLDYFLDYTGLRPFFIDTLTHGQTGLSKEGNIARLVEKHVLQTPVYIGDTEGDCLSAHAAGLPMMHVTYGFGQCDDADFSAASFADVARFFLSD